MSNPHQPTIGDLIEFNAGIYCHWTVYIENEKLAHLVGCKQNGRLCVECENSEIRHDSFQEVAKHFISWRINNLLDNYRVYRENKGTSTIRHLNGNCEHYAMICRYGVNISFQVEELKAKLPGFVKKYEKYKENRKRIKKIFLLIKRRHKYFVIFTLFTCVVLAILAWRFCKKRNNKKK